MSNERRLVGVDPGITSDHTVHILRGDDSEVCRRRARPTVESLATVEAAALAGAPPGTRLVSRAGFSGGSELTLRRVSGRG